MTRDVIDAALFFAVGLPTQVFIYRLRGGRWRDIYGKFWNLELKVASVAAILAAALITWIGHLLFP